MASLTNEGLKEVELIVARNTIEKLKSELAEARQERAEAEKKLAQQVNLGPIVEQRYRDTICELNKHLREANQKYAHYRAEVESRTKEKVYIREDYLLKEAVAQIRTLERQCAEHLSSLRVAKQSRDQWHADAKRNEHLKNKYKGQLRDLEKQYVALQETSQTQREERLKREVIRLTDKLSKADRLIANLKDGNHERLLQAEHDKELAEIGAKYVALNRKYGLAQDMIKRLAWQVNFYRVAHRVMEETVVGVFGKGEPDAKFVLQELSCAYRTRMNDAKDEYKGWQYDPETYRVPDIPKTLHPFVYMGTWHGNQFVYLNPFSFRSTC